MSASVKICGVTSLEDALASIEAGARAIGFVFYAKSPRCLTASQTGAITSLLPSTVKKVGVFVNLHVEQVLESVMRAGLDMAQLSGDESPEECAWLMERGVKVVKAVRPRTADDVRRCARFKDKVHAFNVDAYREGQFGGTGHLSDWSLAREMKAYGKPVILSGGLGPKNVVEAIRAVEPSALDVCSSVEREPGKKDPAKLRLLFEAVRRASEAPRSSTESWGGAASPPPSGPPVLVLGAGAAPPAPGSGPTSGAGSGQAGYSSSVRRAPAVTPFPAGPPQPPPPTPLPPALQRTAPIAQPPLASLPHAAPAIGSEDDTPPPRPRAATPLAPPSPAPPPAATTAPLALSEAPLVDFASASGAISGTAATAPPTATPPVVIGRQAPKAEQSDRTVKTGRRLAPGSASQAASPGLTGVSGQQQPPAPQPPAPAAEPRAEPPAEPPAPPKIKKMGMFDWSAETDRKSKPQ